MLVLEILLGLARCQETNDCCQKKTHGGDTYLLREKDTTLPECHDDCVYEKLAEPGSRYCFKHGGNSSSTCGIGQSFETSDLMMKLEDLRNIVQQNVCPVSNVEPEPRSASFLVRKQTQMEMAKKQSSFLKNLNTTEQKKYLSVYLNNGGLPLPERCSFIRLLECNQNQTAIDQCFGTTVAYSNISSCLNPMCPGCGVNLASFLGLNVNTETSTRFISYSNKSSELANILFTPYQAFNKTAPDFENHLYIGGNGILQPTIPYVNMTGKLNAHRAYWEAKLSQSISVLDANEADMAKTLVEAADKLVDVIGKTKEMYLGDLSKSIKDINLNVEGITAEAKKEIEGATTLLYTSEVTVQKTRAVLENLANDTIDRVNSMLHYLEKVKDDWETDRIVKFMKFQAKEMTGLVERSLSIIKEADNLYTTIQNHLATIQSKLETFNTQMTTLADASSAAHKERVKTIRLEVYIPCCLCILCCPVCAVTLETEIGKWKAALTALLSTVGNNKATVTKLTNEAIDEKKRLGQEVVSLITWSGALHRMSEVDWTFPDAEIFGFDDARPELVSKLDKLKAAAVNYLAINSKKK